MTVGVAGLGIMGSAIAGHLLDHHGALTVWNRDPAKAQTLKARGAQIAESPADLAARCDVIHLSLLDTNAVEAVATGAHGLLVAARRGLIIDHSTISVPATRRLADQAASAGRTWIDAPVSGGRAGAEAGELVVFAGGPPEAMAATQDACAPFARRVTHMGPSGAGQATKTVNQLMVGGLFALLAEAAVLAECNGVDAHALPQALEGGFGDSVLLQRQLPRMVGGANIVHGTAAVMLKDMALVADLAGASGCATPTNDAARALWAGHVGAGHGEQDWVSIIEAVRHVSGLDEQSGGRAA